MAARSGMSNLITDLRGEVAAGTAKFTVSGSAYWSDDQLQRILDRNVQELRGIPLDSEPEWLDGTFVYHRYCLPAGNLEEAASGTSYWRIQDTDYTTVGTSNYAVDYQRGIVTFTSNQAGSLYYVHARSYNLMAAAADVWEQTASFYSGAYDVNLDNQQMTRSQLYKQAMEKAKFYRRYGGVKIAKFVRGDL